MMKKTISALLCISIAFLAIIGLISCDGEKPTVNYKTCSAVVSYSHFNTVSQMSSYGDITDEKFASYIEVVSNDLEYYHRLFDIYYEYSGVNNIRTINKNAGIEPIKVDPALIDFLLYCKELFTLTKGKTNVMMGAVLKIWHDHREDAEYDPGAATVPDMTALREAEKHTSIDSLVIDKEAGTVYISDPAASLDVGAIGKGYATEKLYDKLVAMGADNVALNIGGNIRTIGVKPDGANWVIGLTNPDKSSSDFAARISFGSTACVTSGNYERYYVVNGVNYHHIIDPATLMPAEYFSSVTIITEDSGLADALSTALFCMSYEEGKSLVESLDVEVDVIWIDLDYNLTKTEGILLVGNN